MMGTEFGALSVETYLREQHEDLEKKLEKAQVKVENLETELRKVSRMLDWVRHAAQEKAASAAATESQAMKKYAGEDFPLPSVEAQAAEVSESESLL